MERVNFNINKFNINKNINTSLSEIDIWKINFIFVTRFNNRIIIIIILVGYSWNDNALPILAPPWRRQYFSSYFCRISDVNITIVHNMVQYSS